MDINIFDIDIKMIFFEVGSRDKNDINNKIREYILANILYIDDNILLTKINSKLWLLLKNNWKNILENISDINV